MADNYDQELVREAALLLRKMAESGEVTHFDKQRAPQVAGQLDEIHVQLQVGPVPPENPDANDWTEVRVVDLQALKAKVATLEKHKESALEWGERFSQEIGDVHELLDDMNAPTEKDGARLHIVGRLQQLQDEWETREDELATQNATLVRENASLQERRDYWLKQATTQRAVLHDVETLYPDVLALIRDLVADAKRAIEPIKGWPPHIEAAERLEDHEETLQWVRAILSVPLTPQQEQRLPQYCANCRHWEPPREFANIGTCEALGGIKRDDLNRPLNNVCFEPTPPRAPRQQAPRQEQQLLQERDRLQRRIDDLEAAQKIRVQALRQALVDAAALRAVAQQINDEIDKGADINDACDLAADLERVLSDSRPSAVILMVVSTALAWAVGRRMEGLSLEEMQRLERDLDEAVGEYAAFEG